MNALSRWLHDERRKLEGYSLADRLKYVWQYYKLWILGIAFAVSFISYAVWNYVTVPGEIHFYGILSNTYAQLGEGSGFYNGFVRAAGYDLKQGVVELDCANYCKPSGKAIGNTYYEKIISMLDGGVDDIWIADAEDVVAVGETGRLMDLGSGAAEALFERYADRFIYCTPLRQEYSTEPVPVGIDLTGTALTGEYSAYPDGAVLGVNALTGRLDQAAIFLEYLFGYQDPRGR